MMFLAVFPDFCCITTLDD